MSARHQCLCIDGPLKGETFDLANYEPHVQRRDRQGSKHRYRFSGGQGETWHFIWDDPAHVQAPVEPDRCSGCGCELAAHHSRHVRGDKILCIKCDLQPAPEAATEPPATRRP